MADASGSISLIMRDVSMSTSTMAYLFSQVFLPTADCRHCKIRKIARGLAIRVLPTPTMTSALAAAETALSISGVFLPTS